MGKPYYQSLRDADLGKLSDTRTFDEQRFRAHQNFQEWLASQSKARLRLILRRMCRNHSQWWVDLQNRAQLKERIYTIYVLTHPHMPLDTVWMKIWSKKAEEWLVKTKEQDILGETIESLKVGVHATAASLRLLSDTELDRYMIAMGLSPSLKMTRRRKLKLLWTAIHSDERRLNHHDTIALAFAIRDSGLTYGAARARFKKITKSMYKTALYYIHTMGSAIGPDILPDWRRDRAKRKRGQKRAQWNKWAEKIRYHNERARGL